MPLTFNTLTAKIKDYIERDDDNFVNMIPHFISLAEDKICMECPNLGLEAHITGRLAEGVPVIEKPARWRRTLSLTIGTTLDPSDKNVRTQENRKTLTVRSYDMLRASFPDQNQKGEPVSYSDFGYSHILIGPAPDKDYPFEWVYLERPAPLTIDHQTNWLTEFAAPLLFYACLLEATPYIQTDERIPVWQTFYDRSLKELSQTFSVITAEKGK